MEFSTWAAGGISIPFGQTGSGRLLANCVLVPLLCMSLILTAQHCNAYEAHDIIVRAGLANIDFVESRTVLLDNTLALGDLRMASQRSAVMTVGVMLNDKIGIETLLPLKDVEVDFRGQSGLLAGLPVVSFDALPTAVIPQYHFLRSHHVDAYFGLGVHYISVRHPKVAITTANALSVEHIHSIRIDDSFGAIAQAGIDYSVSQHISVSLSLWYIAVNSRATITFDSHDIQRKAQTAVNNRLRNPTVTVLGLAYRF